MRLHDYVWCEHRPTKELYTYQTINTVISWVHKTHIHDAAIEKPAFASGFVLLAVHCALQPQPQSHLKTRTRITSDPPAEPISTWTTKFNKHTPTATESKSRSHQLQILTDTLENARASPLLRSAHNDGMSVFSESALTPTIRKRHHLYNGSALNI